MSTLGGKGLILEVIHSRTLAVGSHTMRSDFVLHWLLRGNSGGLFSFRLHSGQTPCEKDCAT